MTLEAIKKRNVYTLTFHDVPNIGAVLQAYALQKYIADLGFDCKVVNYRPFYHEMGLLKPYKGLRRNIDKFKLLSNVRQFSAKYLPQTERIIRSPVRLSDLADPFAFVTGSDQIWNPALTGGRPDHSFLLSFPTQARKIAYAASSGGAKASCMGPEVADSISAYHSVSVRERFLEDDLKSAQIRSDVTTVLDPTYLIDGYDEIMSPSDNLPDRYIVSYEVSSSGSRAKFVEAAQAAKERYNLPLVHLGINPIPNCDIDLSPPTPSTWLSAIRNSSLSITNSFHGLLFSVNFNRRFEYVPHREDSKNARARNFMDILGTEAQRHNEPQVNDQLTPVNWRKISPRLIADIHASRAFLDRALEMA